MSIIDFKEKVLSKVRLEFDILEDGFRYWSPGDEPMGAVSAEALRVIADELDRLNKAWSDRIDAEFGGHNEA